jgi:hypothetical protein
MEVLMVVKNEKINHLILNFSHFFGSYPVQKILQLTVNEPFYVGVTGLEPAASTSRT